VVELCICKNPKIYFFVVNVLKGRIKMIAAIDSGRNATKVCTQKGYFSFPSLLGEWHDRTGFRDYSYGPYDLEIEYKGQRFFGGTLAEYECDFATTMHTKTKDNTENLILVLSALFLTCEESGVRVIVGEPITSHTDQNKASLKRLIEGTHSIAINGTKKTFNILECLVSCEGGVSAYSLPQIPDKLRILDFGSSTVNAATLIHGKYVRNQSDTLPFGMETNANTDIERMARRVISQVARKWSTQDEIVVIGGAGEMFLPYVKEEFPQAKLHPQPTYANVIGMYKVACSKW
jgi:plasmid segregation protein ParM